MSKLQLIHRVTDVDLATVRSTVPRDIPGLGFSVEPGVYSAVLDLRCTANVRIGWHGPEGMTVAHRVVTSPPDGETYREQVVIGVSVAGTVVPEFAQELADDAPSVLEAGSKCTYRRLADE